MELAVQIQGFKKTYTLGFARNRRVEAVRGLDLEIERGEVLGFLGPNGAGKTTTLKAMLGLIRPSEGLIEVLGHPAGSVAARRKLGFLPENPYFYGYLNARELLDLCGRLCGVDRKLRKRRIGELLERLGLADKADIPLRKFSKGMLQRVGLAQALLGDPEILILDEPQSGLDPLGRRQVRDIIQSLRDDGKTVFFSSHILPDVEVICDRIALLVDGKLRAIGRKEELVRARILSIEVVVDDAKGETPLPDGLQELIVQRSLHGSDTRYVLRDKFAADALIRDRLQAGHRLVKVLPHRETLEDVFLREAATDPEAGP